MISKNEAYFTTATKTVLTPFFLALIVRNKQRAEELK